MALHFDVLTIFPQIILSYLQESILKRALQRGIIDVKVYNLRDYASDRHKTVDDYPYGGGPGMVMKVEPFYRAINDIKSDGIDRTVIMLTPQGRTFNQDIAKELASTDKRFVLLCGRYEGIDERVRELLVDDEISVGDYVLTGGELPALILIDSITRLIPEALGDDSSAIEDSFSTGMLDYPHYTRPVEFMNLKVPEVLISGNHKAIEQWRRQEALSRTLQRRPDLLLKNKEGHCPKEESQKGRLKRDGHDKSC